VLKPVIETFSEQPSDIISPQKIKFSGLEESTKKKKKKKAKKKRTDAKGSDDSDKLENLSMKKRKKSGK